MNEKSSKTCFVIMPITTPEHVVEVYGGDEDHFAHVLEHLFKPALDSVGLEVFPPKSSGSDIIHADIIGNLNTADLVLCDMSVLNPNVFFELGIRTALDKPVALVVDDKGRVPFDTSIINYHIYDSSLQPWILNEEVSNLVGHLKSTLEKDMNQNALWKYFGVAQSGAFRPEDSTIEDKLDLVNSRLDSLEDALRQNKLATPFDISLIRKVLDEEKKQVDLSGLGDMLKRAKMRSLMIKQKNNL